MNPRPLGCESNPIVARPFCSITYGDDVPWFFLLFGRFCGRSVVENRPPVAAVLRRYAAFVSANAMPLRPTLGLGAWRSLAATGLVGARSACRTAGKIYFPPNWWKEVHNTTPVARGMTAAHVLEYAPSFAEPHRLGRRYKTIGKIRRGFGAAPGAPTFRRSYVNSRRSLRAPHHIGRCHLTSTDADETGIFAQHFQSEGECRAS